MKVTRYILHCILQGCLGLITVDYPETKAQETFIGAAVIAIGFILFIVSARRSEEVFERTMGIYLVVLFGIPAVIDVVLLIVKFFK